MAIKLAMRFSSCVGRACSSALLLPFRSAPSVSDVLPSKGLSLGSYHKIVSQKLWFWVFYVCVTDCAVLMCTKHTANCHDSHRLRQEGGTWAPHGPRICPCHCTKITVYFSWSAERPHCIKVMFPIRKKWVVLKSDMVCIISFWTVDYIINML